MQRAATLRIGSALSLLAGALHVAVTREHFVEWWGYGVFFLLAGVAQAGYALALLKRPSAALYAAGVLGNGAILALYLLTRTVGVPLGPRTGEVEGVGAVDALSKAAESALLLVLALLWRGDHARLRHAANASAAAAKDSSSPGAGPAFERRGS